MQQEHVVRSIEIAIGDRVHKGSYYIERGMIHASVGGRTIRCRAGDDDSDEAMQTLLFEELRRLGTDDPSEGDLPSP